MPYELVDHPTGWESLPVLADALAASARATLEYRGGAPLRLCEVNPVGQPTVALSAALMSRLGRGNVSSYTLIMCGEAVGVTEGPPLRVLHGGPACSVRGQQIDGALGECDFLVAGFYSHAEKAAGVMAPAMRVSLLLELPLLLQHAVPRSHIALHGAHCPDTRGKYSAPFFVKNLTEPCWHEKKWARLVESGALVQPSCGALPGTSHLLCSGTFKARRSACTSVAPLLDASNVRRGKSCVRKEVVNVAGKRSTMHPFWTKATHARSTLSHLYRRHLRYYSVFDCGEPTPAHRYGSSVCLLFKDDVLEEWVAGLQSADGLSFPGDPVLVMPRLTVRTQTLLLPEETSHSKSGVSSGRRARHSKKRSLLRPEATPTGTLETFSGTRAVSPGATGSGMGAAALALPNGWLHNGSAATIVSRFAASMTHNLALSRTHAGEWLAIGGRHNRLTEHLWPNSPVLRRPELRKLLGKAAEFIEVPRLGLWMTRGKSW